MAMLRKAKDQIRAVQGEIESRRQHYRHRHGDHSSSSRRSGSRSHRPPPRAPPRVTLKSIANSQDDSFDRILDELDNEEVSNPLFGGEFESSGEYGGSPGSHPSTQLQPPSRPLRVSDTNRATSASSEPSGLFEDELPDQLFDPLTGATVQSSRETTEAVADSEKSVSKDVKTCPDGNSRHAPELGTVLMSGDSSEEGTWDRQSGVHSSQESEVERRKEEGREEEKEEGERREKSREEERDEGEEEEGEEQGGQEEEDTGIVREVRQDEGTLREEATENGQELATHHRTTEEDAKLAFPELLEQVTMVTTEGPVAHTAAIVTSHEAEEELSPPGDQDAGDETLKLSDDSPSEEEPEPIFYSLPFSSPIPLPQENHLHDSLSSSPSSSFEPDEPFLDALFPLNGASRMVSPRGERNKDSRLLPIVVEETGELSTEMEQNTASDDVLGSHDMRTLSPVVPGVASSPREGFTVSLMSDATEHPLSLSRSTVEEVPPPHRVSSQDSFVYVESDDLFPVQEDYFARDSTAKGSSSRGSTEAGMRHIAKDAWKQLDHTRKHAGASKSHPSRPPMSPHSSPPRPNKAGKLPPPRPATSPRLQKKLQQPRLVVSAAPPGGTMETDTHEQPTGKGPLDHGLASAKIVKPLASAPPPSKPISVSQSSLEQAQAKLKSFSPDQSSIASTSRSSTKEGIFPLDEEFQQPHFRTSRAGKPPVPVQIPQVDPSSVERTHMPRKEKAPASTKQDTFLFDADSQAKTVPSDAEELELIPELPPAYHLLLAGLLYLYYSLNFLPYLSGFFAGFLMVYLAAGTAFIYFARHSEETKERVPESPKLSQAFVDKTKVNFDKLKVYQSSQFAATFDYDTSSHHASDRCKAELKLKDDFVLWMRIQDQLDTETVFKAQVDIRQCKISLEPPEVAQNRKRRWSKKFPIRVFWPDRGKRNVVYLFAPTSRGKEKWFRRMRSASNGRTSEELIQQQREFFAYMEKYFSTSPSQRPPQQRSVKRPPSQQQRRQQPSRQQVYMPPSLVQFSKTPEDREHELSSVSIAQLPLPPEHSTPDMGSHAVPRHSGSNGNNPSGSSVDRPPQPVAQQQTSPRPGPSPVMDLGFEVVPRPTKDTYWIHALAARLCWDVWHEEWWKMWVTTRIQRKLIRVKTPSFMEKLRLTDVKLGKDMPMINHIHDGPKLDLDGVWVYLDVTYRGSFVMTIETKLKLGARAREKGKQKGKELVPVKGRSHAGSGRSPSPQPLSHSRAARTLGGSSVDPGDEIDSGSDEEGGVAPDTPLDDELSHLEISSSSERGSSPSVSPQPQPPTHSSGKASSTGARFISVVSKLTQRVAKTKIVRRAAEKVSSYPLILTVEVKQLDGILAVNIPPPPSDTVWYGFKRSPRLRLVAKPKLGHKEVTLSHVTHWIERKLCELVDKKLLLPNMEDVVIPILNSGMPEDKYGQESPLLSPPASNP